MFFIHLKNIFILFISILIFIKSDLIKFYYFMKKNGNGNIEKVLNCNEKKDLIREISYKNLTISRSISKMQIVKKINFVKNKYNLDKCTNVQMNINDYLKQLYSSNGFCHISLKIKREKRRSKYRNNVDYKLIDEIIENDKLKKMTLKDILVKYNKQTSTAKISITKLSFHMKQIGYKYRKLNTISRNVLSEKSKENQKAVINFLLDKINEGNMVFYADECPLSKNIKKTKGFVKESIKINNAIGNERIKRTTLLYIIGNNGMFYYRLTSEIVNAELFWKFIHDAIIFFLENVHFCKMLNLGKIIICMDNAPIHYRRQERAKYVNKKIYILYNVPYCCFLNPVEYCFSFLKRFLKKIKIKDQEDLLDKTEIYLRKNAENDIQSSVKYSLRIWESLFD